MNVTKDRCRRVVAVLAGFAAAASIALVAPAAASARTTTAGSAVAAVHVDQHKAPTRHSNIWDW